MVHETIIRILSTYRQIVFIASAVIPVITLLVSFVHGVYDGRRAPWRQFYAFVVHLTTLVIAAVAALLVYHIITGGSLDPDAVPIVPAVVIFAGWLLTLAFVKRAVDFSMLRTIRRPFGLLFSWLLGWAAAFAFSYAGIVLIPGPAWITDLAVTLVVFFLVRIVLRLVFGSRTGD